MSGASIRRGEDSIITGRTGNRAFARWSCSGLHLKGCAGKFSLTGGTGALQGITGESAFLVRSAIQELAVDLDDDTVQETAAGVAVWPELRYTIP